MTEHEGAGEQDPTLDEVLASLPPALEITRALLGTMVAERLVDGRVTHENVIVALALSVSALELRVVALEQQRDIEHD